MSGNRADEEEHNCTPVVQKALPFDERLELVRRMQLLQRVDDGHRVRRSEDSPEQSRYQAPAIAGGERKQRRKPGPRRCTVTTRARRSPGHSQEIVGLPHRMRNRKSSPKV